MLVHLIKVKMEYDRKIFVVGSGGANHLNSSGGPSPAGGAGDNVSVSNPFDDVSPSPPPRGGPFPGGPHPSYPTGNGDISLIRRMNNEL